MKKILLLFGIAAYSSALGQQKDIFNVDRYLNKKLAEAGKKADKRTTQPNFNNKVSTFVYKPNLTYLLSNGDKVIILAQDNMPCIVPDMRQFQQMPNIAAPGSYFKDSYFKHSFRGKIPNAAQPK